MKRYVLAIPALALLSACADTIVAPVQSRDSGPAADYRVAPSRMDKAQSGLSTDVTSTGSAVIDFESLAASGTSFAFVTSYSEDGFTLVNPAYSGYDAFSAPQSDNDLFQGSTGLLNDLPDGVTLLTKGDGGSFTVASIDIAEFKPSMLDPREVTFTGTRADGSTVSETFTTDGLAGFETFTFKGFTDLVSLSWVQASPYHQFDNITLDPVALGPQSKSDCWNGGWEPLGFGNQGQCIRMVETGQDSR